MKRLTERDEYGNADIVALSEVMPELYAELSFLETNALTDALNRLAAYEDTGLDPDGFKKLAAYKDLDAEPEEIADVLAFCKRNGLKNLVGLLNAIATDRVIVLPCKVGDTVYAIRHTPWAGKFVRELTALVVGACIRDHQTEIVITTTKDDVYGKTVFLTREEAEEALRRAE